MKMENGGRAWERFLRRLNRKSEGTQKLYLGFVEEFLDKIGMDATEFYELRKKDWNAEDPLDRGEVEDLVADHLNYLKKERGLANGTVWNFITAIAFFLKVIKMPLDVGEIDAPRKIYNGQRKVRTEEIRRMLLKVGMEFQERNKAMILMAKDSGLRISDLSILDLVHYEMARIVYNEEEEPFKEFRPLETTKTGDLAHIRIGPEAIEGIEAWIEVRGREAGALFTKRGGGRMNRKAASAMFRRKTDFLDDGNKVSGHSFRKFHKTGCEAGGIADHWIRRLQGKAHDVYSAPTEEELTEAYMDAYDKLRISEEELVSRKIIEDMTEKMEEQQHQIDMMMPAFNLFLEMSGKRKEWNENVESPKKSESGGG